MKNWRPHNGAKIAKKERKQSRKLMRESPNFSRALSKSLRANVRDESALNKSLLKHLPAKAATETSKAILGLLRDLRRTRWVQRERADKTKSTKRTRTINRTIQKLSRIETQIKLGEFDCFPLDYLAELRDESLKAQRLAAIRSLKASLRAAKGKRGQSNKLKRYLAEQLAAIFDTYGIPRRESPCKTIPFEHVFNAAEIFLGFARLTGNPFHYLKKNKL